MSFEQVFGHPAYSLVRHLSKVHRNCPLCWKPVEICWREKEPKAETRRQIIAKENSHSIKNGQEQEDDQR